MKTTKDISIVKTILSHGGNCGCFPCVECPLSQPEGKCTRGCGNNDDTLKLAQEWLYQNSPSSIVEVVIAHAGSCLGFSCCLCPLEGKCEVTDASSLSEARKWMEENSPRSSSWTNDQGEVFHRGDEVTDAAVLGVRGCIYGQGHAANLVLVVLTTGRGWGTENSDFPKDLPPDAKCWNIQDENLRKSPPSEEGFKDSLGTPIAIGARILCSDISAAHAKAGARNCTFAGMYADGRYKEDRDFGWVYCVAVSTSAEEGFKDSLGTPIAIGARIHCSHASVERAKKNSFECSEGLEFKGMKEGKYIGGSSEWEYCIAALPIEGSAGVKEEFKPGDFVRSEYSPSLRGYIHCMKADGAYTVIRTDGEVWDKRTEALTLDLPEGTKCWHVGAGSLRKAPASDYTSRGAGWTLSPLEGQALARGERITLVCRPAPSVPQSSLSFDEIRLQLLRGV